MEPKPSNAIRVSAVLVLVVAVGACPSEARCTNKDLESDNQKSTPHVRSSQQTVYPRRDL